MRKGSAPAPDTALGAQRGMGQGVGEVARLRKGWGGSGSSSATNEGARMSGLLRSAAPPSQSRVADPGGAASPTSLMHLAA